MKSPSAAPTSPAIGSQVTDGVRVQILATEHWNLLGTRSTLWNEAFSRVSMFLTVLSAAMVALALVAQATAFGQGFLLFALALLPIVLLVGLGTYNRVTQINHEDFGLVVGMNRVRHAYMDIAPELEPYFVTGVRDDIPDIWQTYSRGARPFGVFHLLSSSPHVIAAINAVVTAALFDVILQTLGASGRVSALAGATAGVALLIALLVPQTRTVARVLHDYQPRFPG